MVHFAPQAKNFGVTKVVHFAPQAIFLIYRGIKVVHFAPQAKNFGM